MSGLPTHPVTQKGIGISNYNVESREMLVPGSVQEKYESMSISDRASLPGPEEWGRNVDILP